MIGQVKKTGRVTLLSLEGSFELGKEAKLKEALLQHMSMAEAEIVLNLKDVDFIDSACLGALISVARRVRSSGGDIRLAQLNPEVASIFQITRLDKVFQIFDQPEEAVSSYTS